MYGGMGQPGTMGADPNDPNSLTNTFSQSTQATFQLIESLVGAFGGVAQMLESTYMATHSSFFGMGHLSLPHRLIPMTDVNGSYGIGCRTILQSPNHSRLHPRHLHTPPLPPHPFRKNHRPPSTRGRHIPHSLRLRLLPRPRLSVLAQPTPDPLPKTPPNLPRRRLWSPLPNDKTHPLTRRPILPKPTKPTIQPRPWTRRPTSSRPTTTTTSQPTHRSIKTRLLPPPLRLHPRKQPAHSRNRSRSQERRFSSRPQQIRPHGQRERMVALPSARRSRRLLTGCVFRTY